MSVDFPIIVNALRKKVFNHTVAKTYLKLKQIAQLKTYDEGYQRKRDSEHEAKIIKYLEKSSNRYLPDIILVIRHDEIKFEEKVLLNNTIFKINEDSNGILKITLKKQRFYCKYKNNRWKSQSFSYQKNTGRNSNK